MTTNKPVELGRASDETKQVGIGSGDNLANPFTQEGT
jgi:hypothetical protein